MNQRRVPKSAVVRHVEWLTPEVVRVVAALDDPASMPALTKTDHYVKILFSGGAYAWPFDPEDIRANRPREEWPVTRTYTVRSWVLEANELVLDFVVHGDEGIAGPWAAAVEPGTEFGFMGPGGAWAPDPDADVHLFVGDESAHPAIAAGLGALPESARALVFLEAANAEGHQPLPDHPRAEVTWVHREHDGTTLAETVRAMPWPGGRVVAFIHGNAETVRDLRRYLFVERGMPKSDASISGYWRPGQNEDGWQAGKKDFVAGMEAEEQQLASRR
ncbi:siderophore-interacting protein [Ammonicoccus fulvus]|uniref:Siderophore-interacting protein n=1 Tax=Ammonicoccus fulvus TaxID=3138240 RepID=A0ABZ3FPC2_9ACTN